MKKSIIRMICFILCLVLILPTSVFAGQSTADYNGHWAGKQIKSFLDMGFVKVSKDGNFKPNEAITRAEFAVMTNKAFAFLEKDVENFKDVKVTDAFYEDMLIAKKSGYLAGLPDGTVNPKSYMSRQEYAVIISRLLKLDITKYADEADKFVDAAVIPDWSKGAVGAVARFGYMQGEPGGIFNPEGFVSRGQAVVVLERCYLALVKAAYNKPGTYSAGDIKGNVAINAPGVILENTIVNGNLIIGEGVGNGDVKLKNVIVRGDAIVKGGGLNSIIIEDSQFKNIITVKEDNKVRIVAVGKTTVARVDMQSGGKLEEQDTTGSGFGYITIAESFDSNEPVILMGSFQTVQVLADGVKLNIESGSISRLDVSKTAEGAKINIGEEVKVSELVVQAKAEVTGSGTINKADVKVQGVIITAPATTITAAAGVTVATTLPGQAPAPAPSASTGGNSGGGRRTRDKKDDTNTTVAVSGVTLNHTRMTLTVGETPGTLAATVTPANATDKRVNWSSSNSDIVTVANGLVTPVAAGTATVTVRTVSGAKTAVCKVTVKEREPDSLAVIFTQFEEAGQDIAVTAKYYHNATVSEAVYTDTQLTSDKDVTFILTSSLSEASSKEITEPISLAAGKTESLAGLLADNNGRTISYDRLKDMVDTDFGIKFTHISQESADEYTGDVNITFTALAGSLYDEYEDAEEIGTGIARAEFNVAPIAVTGITLNRNTLTLTAGGASETLEAIIAPTNATDKRVAWSSSNESAAVVDNGVVTSVGAGVATITATTADGGKTANCIVTVINEEEADIEYLPNFMAGLTVNNNSLNIITGGLLTAPIDVNKLVYTTSENGEYSHRLSGNYTKVNNQLPAEQGQYSYYQYDVYTSVLIWLTDDDAAAIKGLERFGNTQLYAVDEYDRLSAEEGWYPNAGPGVKQVAISKQIDIENHSGIEIAGIYYFDKNDVLIGSRSVMHGYTQDVNVDMLTSNIVFYSGTYVPNVTPTSGKMKTVSYDATYTDEITLDASGWADVNENNFGPTAPEETGDESTFTINSFAINYGYSEEDLIFINFYPQGEGDATGIDCNDLIVQVGDTLYDGEEGTGAPSAGKFTAVVFEPGINIGILQIKGVEPFDNGVTITLTGKNRLSGSADAQFDVSALE